MFASLTAGRRAAAPTEPALPVLHRLLREPALFPEPERRIPNEPIIQFPSSSSGTMLGRTA